LSVIVDTRHDISILKFNFTKVNKSEHVQVHKSRKNADKKYFVYNRTYSSFRVLFGKILTMLKVHSSRRQIAISDN